MLEDILTYNRQINQAIWEHYTASQAVLPDRLISLFCHLLNAHQIWNARIEGLSENGVWQLHEWSQLPTLNQQNYTTTIQILSCRPLTDTVHYQNSQGIRFQNTVQEILIHVLNHSTYHRGQIAMEARLNGLTPLSTDYIVYKREQSSSFL